jgi:hypothetical protein
MVPPNREKQAPRATVDMPRPKLLPDGTSLLIISNDDDDDDLDRYKHPG